MVGKEDHLVWITKQISVRIKLWWIFDCVFPYLSSSTAVSFPAFHQLVFGFEYFCYPILRSFRNRSPTLSAQLLQFSPSVLRFTFAAMLVILRFYSWWFRVPRSVPLPFASEPGFSDVRSATLFNCSVINLK